MTRGAGSAPEGVPFGRVVFDVDSTLSTIEGIDEMARIRGADVSALTDRAMRGEVPLESVYGERLALVRPDAELLARVGALYVERLTPGAAALVQDLLGAGVEVLLVSGGIRQAVLHLAASIGIAPERVHAVDVRLDEAGAYAGFDEDSPLARAEGKRTLLARLRRPRLRTAFVGDGATDLAAAPAVDLFVAFTGVAERASVVSGAAAAVRTLDELRPLLGLAQSPR